MAFLGYRNEIAKMTELHVTYSINMTIAVVI